MKSEFYSKLNKQWGDELPFVIFSLPTQTDITAFLQVDKRLTTDPKLQKKGFVFGGFNSLNKVFTIEPDCVLNTNKPLEVSGSMEFSITDHGDKSAHINAVKSAVNKIKNSSLEKVVLARAVKARIQSNLIDLYLKLNAKYPTAFTYCLYHPKIGLWLGASPELLVSTSEKKFKTVSLAGTRWANLNGEWGTKELEEQQLVTRYIQGKLKDLDLDFNCSAVQTIQAGELLHLKQEFIGELKATQLNDLIAALHPTPAVCGLPADIAHSYITANEELDRSFYAGFMGPIQQLDANGTTYSYLGVNIRCMQLIEQTAYLYVGGGITADSDPELEWEETVKKSMTLSSIFD